jgi:photosynthetic reaction center H subunit
MGAITGYIDVAQLALYLFWGFFAALVIYLQRESKREGFPLVSDDLPNWAEDRGEEGFPKMPKPKEFRLHDGTVVSYPADNGDKRDLAIEPAYAWPGSPYEPTGNPLADGVGPASWAARADVPDMTHEHKPKIAPMRAAEGFTVAETDPDPRGWTVVAADGNEAGTIAEIWVDTEEVLIRYLEVDVAGSERNVLLPMTFCRIDSGRRQIKVSSITAEQFAGVPGTTSPDQVTRLEEDKIMGYFGGGHLYATPDRRQPLL